MFCSLGDIADVSEEPTDSIFLIILFKDGYSSLHRTFGQFVRNDTASYPKATNLHSYSSENIDFEAAEFVFCMDKENQ
jgi:hypothetical protein